MNCLLKNGGWRGIGEFVSIHKELNLGGQTVQVCSYDRQTDPTGQRRSRNYFELRTRSHVVSLPPEIKSIKAAVAEAERMFS